MILFFWGVRWAYFQGFSTFRVSFREGFQGGVVTFKWRKASFKHVPSKIQTPPDFGMDFAHQTKNNFSIQPTTFTPLSSSHQGPCVTHPVAETSSRKRPRGGGKPMGCHRARRTFNLFTSLSKFLMVSLTSKKTTQISSKYSAYIYFLLIAERQKLYINIMKIWSIHKSNVTTTYYHHIVGMYNILIQRFHRIFHLGLGDAEHHADGPWCTQATPEPLWPLCCFIQPHLNGTT